MYHPITYIYTLSHYDAIHGSIYIHVIKDETLLLIVVVVNLIHKKNFGVFKITLWFFSTSIEKKVQFEEELQ